MRILFITANRIGDAVLTTGLLRHLSDLYPEVRLTIACGPVAAPVFRAAPGVERLILLKKKKLSGHWIVLWRECVGTRWDLIVDLRNSVVSRLLCGPVKRYAPRRATAVRHKVRDYAAVLGLEAPPSPHLWIDEKAESEAETLVGDRGPFLALGPSANWPAKQWPAERFAVLAQKLIAPDGLFPGAKVALAAAAHEREQIAPVYEALGADRVIDLAGLDLMTVAACLRRAAFYIGHDSGLTHLAAAAGVPTLALFGPGWEDVYGPWGEKTAVVRTPESVEELIARLPYPGAFYPNLMESLSVEAVLAAVEALSLKEKSENMSRSSLIASHPIT